MNTSPIAPVLATVVAAALAGCGKTTDAVAEKAAEKAIESAMEKDGGKAKVDLRGDGATITTTDASGKTSQMQMGVAQVTEADLGVPYYPGTRPAEGQSTRIDTPEGTMVTVGLASPDAPDKVAAFYRDTLKARAEGRQMIDMTDGSGGATLSLADEKAGATLQVHVARADQGSEIQIVATRGKQK